MTPSEWYGVKVVPSFVLHGRRVPNSARLRAWAATGRRDLPHLRQLQAGGAGFEPHPPHPSLVALTSGFALVRRSVCKQILDARNT